MAFYSHIHEENRMIFFALKNIEKNTVVRKVFGEVAIRFLPSISISNWNDANFWTPISLLTKDAEQVGVEKDYQMYEL